MPTNCSPKGPAARLGLLAAFLLLSSGVASANSLLNPTGVDWSRGMGVKFREKGQDVNAYFAGVIFISLYENGARYDRDTLCADLFTNIYIGQQYSTELVDPATEGGMLTRAAWLVSNALMPVGLDHPFVSGIAESDWVATPAQGAGIQLAVWDMVHDNGDGFDMGSVMAGSSANPTNPEVLAWARRYQALSLGRTSLQAFVYENTSASGVPAQRLIGPVFMDGGPVADTPTPEPVTAALVGTALIALGACFRKRLSAQRD